MAKHPLLPEPYTDPALHRILLTALAPYERKTKDDIPLNNPSVKWDLARAWDEAQPVLKLSHWRYAGIRDEQTPVIEWVLDADTEDEKDNLYTLMAGIVARQILEPESGYELMRVQVKKGGEMSLFISDAVQKRIAADPEYAQAKFEGMTAGESRSESDGLLRKAMKRIFGRQ